MMLTSPVPDVPGVSSPPPTLVTFWTMRNVNINRVQTKINTNFFI